LGNNNSLLNKIFLKRKIFYVKFDIYYLLLLIYVVNFIN
jgi:hypothetical protein